MYLGLMTKKHKTIVVIGTHGQKNLGDDLLLESFLVGLKRYCTTDVSFVVNSYDPVEIVERHSGYCSVQSFHTTKDIFKLPKILWKSDVVMFAGGSILKELYSTTGRIASSSLLMIFGVVAMARLLGKPVVLSHIGVSSLKRRFPRFVARCILMLVNKVSFRDQDSFDLAVSIYPKIVKKSSVVPDIVFSLPKLFDASNALGERVVDDGVRKLQVGLNLNAAIKDPQRWDQFVQEIEGVLIRLNELRNIELVLIPFQSDFEKLNDEVVLEGVKRTLAKYQISSNIVKPMSYHEMCRVLKKIDLFVVERFHGVVLAALTDTQFFALRYDPKVTSLVDRLNMLEYSVDIYQELNITEVAEKMLDAIGTKKVNDRATDLVNSANDSVVDLARYVDAL